LKSNENSKKSTYFFDKPMGVGVATLALGSQPRQGLVRLRAKREAWESHLVFSRMEKRVRESTFTLLSELPLWELESQMVFQIFKDKL
jgi:hypothetical protein